MKDQIYFIGLLFFSFLAVKAQKTKLEEIAKKNDVPAIQVVHVKNGKYNSLAYGKKRADAEELITEKSVFQAASLSKVICAYTFFRLYDKGLIALDIPLSQYYKYNRLTSEPKADVITARMVLTHRTGFMNWDGAVGTDTWRESPLHIMFEPNSRYMYSGEGFYYLQLVMEHITGKSLAQLVKEELLVPFAMNNSYFKWNEEIFTDYAFGHYEQLKPRNFRKYEYVNAAYTFYTNALDYTTFIQKALVEGKGLRKTTHRLMISKAAEVRKDINQFNKEDKYVPVVLGLRLQLNEKGIWLWHTGSNPGYRCFFIVNPKTKESLVSFNNSDTGMPIFKELMELFLEKGQTFWAWEWNNGELD